MAPVVVRHRREKSQVLPPNQKKAQLRKSNSSELCGTETKKKKKEKWLGHKQCVEDSRYSWTQVCSLDPS